ncbi:MAG TPA: YibE/F family protein [Micromonosporaceae bacterium]
MSDRYVQQGEASSRSAVRVAVFVLVTAGLLSIAAMAWLWPSKDLERPDPGGQPTVVTGTVTKVILEPCPEGPGPDSPDAPPQPDGGRMRQCGTVRVTLTSGADRGEQIETDIPSGPGAPTVQAGDAVKLIYTPDAIGGTAYQIQDHQRDLPLWLLGGLFAVAVIAFGRWRGITSLVGLAVTFAVLLLFIVPAILEGQQPLLVAIVGSAVIMLTVLYLTHGFNISTSVAVVGTLVSLVLTGMMAALATSATRLTGVASEETAYLNVVYGQVDMRGLLLAGILIGCLGVLDDVTVTQAATVTELARANPDFRVWQLYEAATRVGRSHIASVVNTIVLAYAGASLPLLVLIAAGSQPLGQTLTNPLIAQEIVRAVVGTLGLVAAVPVTTMLAALTARPYSERHLGEHPDGRGFDPATPEREHTGSGSGSEEHHPDQNGADPAPTPSIRETGGFPTLTQRFPRSAARGRAAWPKQQ